AKERAVISYAEMRFKWGNMEFSRPSCFLREIDSRYIDSEVDFTAQRVRPEPEGEEPRAIDELRRRFDYRFQQQRQQGASGGSFGGSANRFGRPADGESNRAQRFSRQNDPYRNTSSTSYPHPKTQYDERLERAISSLGNEQRRTLRSVGSVGSPAGASTAPVGDFTVGDRVDHALFGVGEVVRIERMAGDMKLVVDFQKVGQKPLLAKFAKLRK
ncbi:MAG: ATP-dependent DNA helicase, partial [Alistipes sp.]|nr:ATP-dependent DNA helicase [Alistipes sp.]